MRNNLNALAIKKESLLTLVLLIGMAVLAPLLFKQQLITGTIVNAALIVGVSLLGVRDGLRNSRLLLYSNLCFLKNL
jgi:hypothetical protein